MTEINQLLKAGIQALKAGNREDAHKLLLQVVKQDEESELGWLWLSGAVQTNKERRICLDNVLTINPDNETAKKGLIKMGFPLPQLDHMVAETAVPEADFNLADPFYEVQLPEVNDPHKQKFEDIWTESADICAYCANPVTRGEKKCSRCHRPMIGKELINVGRSKYLSIWIGLRTVSHALSFIGLIAFMSMESEGVAQFLPAYAFVLLVSGVYLVLSTCLTIALFFRQPWAYWLTVGILILSYGSAFAVTVWESNILQQVGVPSLPLWLTLICAIPYITIQVAYVYMIIMAGGDFKKEKRWRVAAVSLRIKEPMVLDRIGKDYAKQKMWATAVLYWQRAVGINPGNTAILRRLAGGYAQLGFYERSLDTLKAALEKAREPKVQQQISTQIAYVQNQLQSK
jgi:tetratricopeptide (TPR) repeat protein